MSALEFSKGFQAALNKLDLPENCTIAFKQGYDYRIHQQYELNKLEQYIIERTTDEYVPSLEEAYFCTKDN